MKDKACRYTGHIQPLILSGGSGTRLWPVSRRLNPKQLHKLTSDKSILQETALRVSGDKFLKPLVICNNEHRFVVAEQFREIRIEPGAIILEPVGRNTAPAVTTAALLVAEKDPETIFLVLPSDHVIDDNGIFHNAINRACEAARYGALATFGITPDNPATGYGYIRRGDPFRDIDGCFTVSAFVEKPDAATAEAFLADDGYSWNSGMFVFSARNFLEEMERLAPATVAGCRKALADGHRDLEFFRLGETAFSSVKPESIDYAVMEHTDKAVVVALDSGWNDLGSWSSIWNIADKDEHGNALSGDVLAVDTSNSYLRSMGPLLATVGMKNHIVVAMDDAVLVAAMDQAEHVKAVVEKMEAQKRPESHSHLKVLRPWGSFTILKKGDNFQVKQLSLKPGARLSLQRHRHRAEHWTVVSGTARVVIGDDTLSLTKDQSAYIRIGAKHSLENTGDDMLHIIEVQTGSYLEEDDIERFEDIYGRN